MKESLVTVFDKKSVASEAFRTLRTNIQFSSYDKKLQVITITSATPGDGKSTVAANLAVVFGENDNRVLLIDADLRRPMIHKILALPNSLGLVNAVVNKEAIQLGEYIQKEVLPSVDVLTSGPIPPNPSELLGSKKNVHLIESLRKDYDIIIIDAPPLLAVTDAQVLSTISDGSIILTRHGETKKEELIRGKELLEKVKGNILGVVLNDIPYDEDSYYYYSYKEKRSQKK